MPPILRITPHHESHPVLEEHELPKQEIGPADGQTGDKRRSFFTMTKSSMGEKVTARTVVKDVSPRIPPSQTLQPPGLSLPAYEQAGDPKSRPVNAPYERINSNIESSHGHPRPKSAGNLTVIPQPQRPPPPAPRPSQPATSGASQTRHARTKLNLLNPMSLLARRRSSQAVTEATSDKNFQAKNVNIPGMNLPADYDPRIRGNVVHDFSAPRPGRSFSSNDLLSSADGKKNRDFQGIHHHKPSLNLNSLALPEDDSPNSVERQHTPVFKEHFDDDIGGVQLGIEGSAKQNTSAFMYQLSLNESDIDSDSASLPPFARNLPNRLSKVGEGILPASHPSNPPLEVVLEATPGDGPCTETLIKTSPPISPPKTRSRASSSTDSPFQPSGLPRRLKSNASRFSFDLAGVGSSAQEKLLEEKHRQKVRQKLPDGGVSGVFDINDIQNDVNDEDYSDYGDVDSDDGLEERIPGVNADDDDLMMPLPLQTNETSHYPLPNMLSLVNPLDSNPMSNSSKISHDSQSPSIQSAATETTQTYGQKAASISSAILDAAESNSRFYDAPSSNSRPVDNSLVTQLAGLPSRHGDEDDLYFDDGMIEDLENQEGPAFDESVFDDDTSRIYGLPLRDLKPQIETHKTSELLNTNLQVNSSFPPSQGFERAEPEDLARNESRDSFLEFNRKSHPPFSHSAGLTEDNLAAYHDALAFAANKAALNGEFNRRQSLTSPGGQDGLGNEIDSAPGMTPDDGRVSQEMTGLFYGQGMEDPEGFDFDDTLSDDPIIAAANAEALENDDDGFYGQEFGFFARATGSAEYANGGYFGSRGVEGINRSHSGRVNFQEPSLTPITERSEWSNRNSAISLAMQGYSQSMQPTVSNPGLAQLADIMSREEDNMSLSALMKLRRGAWGGSTTSLQSSSGSQISGSPLNLLPIFSTSLATATNPATASTFSLASSSGLNSSDSDASPSSPTITLTTQNRPYTGPPPPSYAPPPPPLPPPPSRPEDPLPPPRSSQVRAGGRGHSRHNSGAESVSYVHETDADGSRWVIEKRRLGEGGKMEVLGREVLRGGRI